MTLKDKSQLLVTEAKETDYKYLAGAFEFTADEYAKEVLRTYINSRFLQHKQSMGDYSLDDLLRMIKKEKGF